MSLALVINSGQVERVGATVSPEPLLVRGGAGAGIDLDAGGTLEIGVATATAITIGSGGAGGVMTTVAGDLTVSGNEIIVGTTTFNGNTQIGDAKSDTLEVQASIINSTAASLPFADTSLLFDPTDAVHRILIDQQPGTGAGSTLYVMSAQGGDNGAGIGGGGGPLFVLGGDGGAGTGSNGGAGAPVTVKGGNSGTGTGTQAGGSLTLEGGDATASTGSTGGGVFIRGGDGLNGGGVLLEGGDGSSNDGSITIGTGSTTLAVTIGSPTASNDVPTTISVAPVSGSAGNSSVTLNATGNNLAGSYGVGVYDNFPNVGAISNDNLQATLEAFDTAIGAAGTDTLQTAYDAGRTIDIGSVTETQPVAITNSTNANGGLTISQTFASAGDALGITMGASTTGSGISILMTSGATGAALNAGDGTDSIRLRLTGITNSQAMTFATDDNAAGDGSTGFQITTQTGDGADGTGATPGGTGGNINEVAGTGGAGTGTGGGFGGNGGQYISTAGPGGAGGGVGSGSGGASTIAGGNGAAADATFAGSGGGQISRGGIGGAGTGVIAGGAGGSATNQGGAGGDSSGATGTAGAGGDSISVGGAAGAANTGTGAAGGDAIMRGGAGSGAAADGLCIIGDQDTSGVEVGATANGITLDITSTETTPTSRARAQALNFTTTVGTVQANIGVFVTDGNPNTDTDLSAQSGSIALDDTGAVWVNTSGGGVGTTWSMLASGAGNTLQQAYDAGPDISQDASGGIEISKNDASGNTEYVLRLDDVDDAAGTNTMEINKSPAVASTGGHALAITVGANSTGDGINIVDAGTGPAIFVNKTGATGSALTIQDGGTTVAEVTAAGAVDIDPTPGNDSTTTALNVAQEITSTMRVSGAQDTLLTMSAAATATGFNIQVSTDAAAGGATGGDVLVGALASAGTAGGAEIRAGGGSFGDPNEGQLNIVATDDVNVDAAIVTVDATDTMSFDAASTSNFSVSGNSAGNTDVNIAAANAGAGQADITMTADDDIFFDANGAAAPIPFNATGADADLDSGFTATSIIGALNELLNGNSKLLCTTQTVNSTTAINAGEAVAMDDQSGSARAFQADANSGTDTERAVGLALAGAAVDAAITIVLGGEVDVPDAAFTGGVPGTGNVGQRVFLSDTPGLLTLTAPGGSSRVLKLGTVSRGGSGAVRVLVGTPDSIKL